MSRDASEYHEASYESDPAERCDTLDDHIEELISQRLPKASAETRKSLVRLFIKVLRQLLNDGRLGALVDIKQLSGRELLARVIGEIIDSPRPQLMACCVDFTFGLGIQIGKNETEIAQDHDVTKATVSRYCVHLKQVYLEGRPASGMKSNKAVETYRDLRLGKSSRPPRSEWKFAQILKNSYESNS